MISPSIPISYNYDLLTPPSISIIKKLLDSLAQQLDNIIQISIDVLKGSAVELAIEVGILISLAINNARTVYRDSFFLTLDKVNDDVREVFNKLLTMVNDFNNATANTILLNDLKLKVKDFLDHLPFTINQPRLTNITPRYLIFEVFQRIALVTFEGLFPHASQKWFRPILWFEGHKCRPLVCNEGEMVFEIPLKSFQENRKETIDYRLGKLEVPWNNGSPHSKPALSVYQVVIAALPILAGRGYVEYVSKKIERVKKEIVSAPGEERRREFFEMPWRMSIFFKPKDHESISKVVFEAYNGEHGEFDSPSPPDLPGRLLKIAQKDNGKWQVWAVSPTEYPDLKASDCQLGRASDSAQPSDLKDPALKGWVSSLEDEPMPSPSHRNPQEEFNAKL
jgi:hypothetical protein